MKKLLLILSLFLLIYSCGKGSDSPEVLFESTGVRLGVSVITDGVFNDREWGSYFRASGWNFSSF